MDLKPLDSCEVLVLVDNVSDLLSTVPANVTSERLLPSRSDDPDLPGDYLRQSGQDQLMQTENISKL